MVLEWGTLLVNVLSFALLLWLLKRLFYRPVLNWLERRRKVEEERLSQAKVAQEKAATLLEARERELAEANRRAREIVVRAEAEAKRILSEARLEARAQARAILQAAEAAAARLQEEALVDLRRAYAELVLLGAREVLAREVRASDHERFLSELTARVDARLLS